MKARWLALLLVLAIAPGTMEIVELATHFARHGDLADAVGDTHGTSPLGTDEHGCGGTFHICSCHGGQSARTPDWVLAVVPAAPPSARTRGLHAVASLQGLLAAMPDLRPPIG